MKPTKLAGSYALAITQHFICSRFARALKPGAMVTGDLDVAAIEDLVGQGRVETKVVSNLPEGREKATDLKTELSEQIFTRAWKLKNRLRPESVRAMVKFAPERLHYLRRLARIEAICDDEFRDSDYVALFLVSLHLLEKSPSGIDLSHLDRLIRHGRLRWTPQGASIRLPAFDAPLDSSDAQAIAESLFRTEHERHQCQQRIRAMVEPIRLEVRPAIVDALPQGDPHQDLRFMLALLTDNGEMPSGATLRWAIDFATFIFCNQAYLVHQAQSSRPPPAERARFVFHSAEILFGETSRQTPGVAFDLCGISLLEDSIEKEVRMNSLQMNLAAVRKSFQRFLLSMDVDSSWLTCIWDCSVADAPEFMKRTSQHSRTQRWWWWRSSRLGQAMQRLANAGHQSWPRPRRTHTAALFKSGVRVLSALGLARIVDLNRFGAAVRDVERDTAAAASQRRANGDVLSYDDLYKLAEHRREILRRHGLTD